MVFSLLIALIRPKNYFKTKKMKKKNRGSNFTITMVTDKKPAHPTTLENNNKCISVIQLQYDLSFYEWNDFFRKFRKVSPLY